MEHGGPVRVGGEMEDVHSRMGIASFIIAIVATVVILGLFVASFAIVSSEFGNVQDPQSLDPQSLQDSPAFAWFTLVGLGILVCLLLYLVGLALGVAGIIQRRRRKLFAVLGTVGNGVVLLGFAALVVLGLALGGLQGAP